MSESAMECRKIERVHFLGVKIDNVSFGDVHEFIKETIKKNEKGYICANDVGNVIGASRDEQFLRAVNSSSVNIADGTPLTWYAKLVGCREIERISGMDMMARMFAANDGFRHFLLGDTEERISKVIEKARGIDSKIQISGYSPPFKEFDQEDNRMMMERLNRAAPDIIWVSFGGEKQEKWMHDNISKLDGGIMIGVGAAFKWFIGDLVLPHKIVQRMGLQWLFRISQMMLSKRTRDMKRIKRALYHRWRFALSFPGEVMKERKQIEDKIHS